MKAEGTSQRIDDNDRLHFITSYSPYFINTGAGSDPAEALPGTAVPGVNTKRSDQSPRITFCITKPRPPSGAPPSDHNPL
jgi:hypothetical protein